MRMITIKIDERTRFGKQFLSLVEFFSSEKKGVSIVKDENSQNESGLDLALEDVKAGRVTTYTNSDDLFEKVL